MLITNEEYVVKIVIKIKSQSYKQEKWNSFMFPKKKWLKNKKPTSELRKQIRKLDKVFSEYIRLKDTNPQGLCFCITCNRPFHWRDGDAGHFVQRDRLATRFDEYNVNAQCKYCNRFRSGEQARHGMEIDKKYGEGTAQRLLTISKAKGTKLDLYWIDVKLKEYKKIVKELKDKLG